VRTSYIMSEKSLYSMHSLILSQRRDLRIRVVLEHLGRCFNHSACKSSESVKSDLFDN